MRKANIDQNKQNKTSTQSEHHQVHIHSRRGRFLCQIVVDENVINRPQVNHESIRIILDQNNLRFSFSVVSDIEHVKQTRALEAPKVYQ